MADQSGDDWDWSRCTWEGNRLRQLTSELNARNVRFPSSRMGWWMTNGPEVLRGRNGANWAT
jgi:hypothetical protein